MLEQVENFVIGDTVIYNPNMPNLAPPEQRLYDIAKVIAFEGDYVNIQFKRSGFITKILAKPLCSSEQSSDIQQSCLQDLCSNDFPFPVYTTYALTHLNNQDLDINKIDE